MFCTICHKLAILGTRFTHHTSQHYPIIKLDPSRNRIVKLGALAPNLNSHKIK